VFNALVVFGALTLLIGGQEGIRPVKAGSKYCQGFCFETNGGKKQNHGGQLGFVWKMAIKVIYVV